MSDISNQSLSSTKARNIVEKLLTNLVIKNYTTDISPVTMPGENYMGLITKVQVNGEKDGKLEKLKFIVKRAPHQKALRSYVPIPLLYEREIYIYSKVLLEFTKLQEEKGFSKPFRSFAKYWGSTMDHLNETVVTEDMKENGFELADRRQPLDYNHVLLVMREYGKFHALSYALRDQKPELFKELCDGTQESCFSNMEYTETRITGLRNVFERALNTLDPVKHKFAYEKFKKIQEKYDIVVKVCKSEPAGNYAVIGHGDCWSSNILFKYGNPASPKSPTELCFLDWQLARLGSPALDLSCFIFTCTDKELRDEHYENLIREYYGGLSSLLLELGSDPDKLLPFEVLQEHLKKFSVYGLYMCLWIICLMTSEAEEIPDIYNSLNAGDIIQKFQHSSKNEKFKSRIRDVILDFVKFGYEF